MATLLAGLIRRDSPVARETWHTFFDRLHERRLLRGEAAAVLASLSTVVPDDDTLDAFVDVLDERADGPRVEYPDAVNIVGTGGGPGTFNVSTAAALVAAATGVRVIKTGSRAVSGQVGSFDLLNRVGIGLTGTHEETLAAVDRHGVAFTGIFVYPAQIAQLAREVAPLGPDSVGRFVNTIGPFLARLSVGAQLTGYSRPADLPVLRRLATRTPGRRTWLCGNMIGADELVSIAENVIHRGPDDTITVPSCAAGTLADLALDTRDVVGQFRDVLAGDAAPAAVRTVCLNAAALALLTGAHNDLMTALTEAEAAVRSGTVLALLDDLGGAEHPTPVHHG